MTPHTPHTDPLTLYGEIFQSRLMLGERTLQINGLYRHGFLISPAMLDVVVEWVQHHTTTLAEQFHLKFEHV